MASKIANSGLSLSHIILTFKRDGQQGLENLLSEICENSKVREWPSQRWLFNPYLSTCILQKSSIIIVVLFKNHVKCILYSDLSHFCICKYFFLYEGTKVHLYWYNFLCGFFKGSGGHIIIQIVVWLWIIMNQFRYFIEMMLSRIFLLLSFI